MTCKQHGTNDFDAVEKTVKGETPLFNRERLEMLDEVHTVPEAA
jgi:hypothetical protein